MYIYIFKKEVPMHGLHNCGYPTETRGYSVDFHLFYTISFDSISHIVRTKEAKGNCVVL